jgi:hypothetical protein
MLIKSLLTEERTKRYAIGLRDVVFSLYYAVGASIAVTVSQSKDRLPTWEELRVAAIAGFVLGLQHIIRKYLTGPKDEITTK